MWLNVSFKGKSGIKLSVRSETKCREWVVHARSILLFWKSQLNKDIPKNYIMYHNLDKYYINFCKLIQMIPYDAFTYSQICLFNYNFKGKNKY